MLDNGLSGLPAETGKQQRRLSGQSMPPFYHFKWPQPWPLAARRNATARIMSGPDENPRPRR
jgi:hypothetical protein